MNRKTKGIFYLAGALIGGLAGFLYYRFVGSVWRGYRRLGRFDPDSGYEKGKTGQPGGLSAGAKSACGALEVKKERASFRMHTLFGHIFYRINTCPVRWGTRSPLPHRKVWRGRRRHAGSSGCRNPDMPRRRRF